MTTRRTFILTTLIALASILSIGATPAFAQDKAELQKRFKQRDPEIRKLKAAGKVGETSDGYLDFVEGGSSSVVDEENADRRTLYAMIAKEEGISAETVATRNAKRNFERAAKGEFLKEGGKWKKKE
jgi:uncharacterized protein YdbL (DUF1318 family)